MNDEFYPVVLYYSDAACSESPNDRGLRDGYNMDFIHGLYRISDDAALEIAVQWAHFPSFCGGSYAHSPVVRIVHDRSWGGGILGRGVREDPGSIENLDPAVIDLRKHGLSFDTYDEWKNYGYRALANGMFAKMAYEGKRGCVMSGPEHNEINTFIRELQKVTTLRRALASHGKLPWNDYDRVHIMEVATSSLYVQVQPTDSFVNFNSGNDCHFYPIVLTTDLLGGEEGRNNEEEARDRAYDAFIASGAEDDDYYFDDWYDDHYHEFLCNGDVETSSMSKEEKDYAAIAGKYARRYTWSN